MTVARRKVLLTTVDLENRQGDRNWS